MKALFPVYIKEIKITGETFEEIQDEITDAYKKAEFFKLIKTDPEDMGDISLTGGALGTGNNFIEDNNLQVLRKTVLDNCLVYCEELGIEPEVELKIADSWMTHTKTGQFSVVHDHRVELINAVYYYQATGVEGDLRFFNPLKFKNFSKSLYEDVTPLTGKLVFFPGWIEHQVLPNPSQLDRMSVAINIETFLSK